MLLQDKKTGGLVDVSDADVLSNPTENHVMGRLQNREAEQPVAYEKTGLIFPSGENLPRCWVDKDYQSQK